MGYSDTVYFTVDTNSPSVFIQFPEDKTYAVSDVPLTFTVSESTSWMGYSLDGQANVTITGNIVLTGLSDGKHNLTVYASDAAGNTGAHETITFSVNESLPTTWIVATVAIMVVAITVAVVYLMRQRKKRARISEILN